MVTMTNFYELDFHLFPRPPYSSDLSHSDYYLFASLKKCFKEKLFPKYIPIISNNTNNTVFEVSTISYTKKALKC